MLKWLATDIFYPGRISWRALTVAWHGKFREIDGPTRCIAPRLMLSCLGFPIVFPYWMPMAHRLWAIVAIVSNCFPIIL